MMQWGLDSASLVRSRQTFILCLYGCFGTYKAYSNWYSTTATASGTNQGSGVTLSRSVTVANELILANGFIQSSEKIS